MTSATVPIRVLIVDDHPIVRHGLAQLLGQEADISICGEAADARAALDAMVHAAPDVLIVDISLGGASGLDFIREAKTVSSRVAALVVSMHDELLFAERAIRAGALGYVMKHEATDVIARAVRAVATGATFVSEAVTTRIVRRVAKAGARGAASELEILSDRELNVLLLIGRGLGTRDIAERLHVSMKTVESYRARLKEKMNLRSGPELVRYAVRWADNFDGGGDPKE
jgi:DNA-binding NarL/FixJ family response regulator